MNDLQLELTKLLGRKELSFGCWIKIYWELDVIVSMWSRLDTNTYGDLSRDNIEEIIGHHATLSDLFRIWNKLEMIIQIWDISNNEQVLIIAYFEWLKRKIVKIKYLSSKDLLDQDEETLKQIIELISSNQ